jgi:alpha-D-xyloside xylohydrolase
MRLHGIGPREPWSYGAEAERAAMAALELRYRLLPYLWRAVQQASTTGLPVQRAMALACPGEPEAWGFDQQFFCGDDLLVAPCLDPSGRIRVYLPHGEWRRFPAGEPLAGGRTHELVLGLAEQAVFARAGAEIPLGPAVAHTAGLGAAPRVTEVWRAR